MTVQGVQGEDRSDYTKAESKQIRARSRRLLGSLLKPHMTRVVLTMVLVVIAVAASGTTPFTRAAAGSFGRRPGCCRSTSIPSPSTRARRSLGTTCAPTRAWASRH